MLRRTPARLLVLLLAACVAAGLATPSWRDAAAADPASGTAPAEQPNIVVVLVDDMRADELTALQDTVRLLQPNGIEFTRAIAPHPLCCPSRAGLLTGQYAQNNGVQHNRGMYGGLDSLRDRTDTVATWLQAEGYRTGYVGKYLNGYTQHSTLEPGWDRWRALAHMPVALYDRFQFYGDDAPTEGYITTSVSRETVTAVHRLAGLQPFFLFVNHTAPHERLEGGVMEPPPAEALYADHPVGRDALRFVDKPSFNEDDVSDLPRFLRRKRVDPAAQVRLAKARIRALQSVDDAMEALFAALDQTGEMADTWVVFTSDNGFMLGEHRLRRKNYLFRESLDVPLLIRGPEVPADGGTSRTFATLLDVAATVADLGGVTPGHPLDGTSLLPTLRGEQQPWRDTVLVQTGRGADGGEQPGWQYRGVRTARYLYAADVNEDPGGDVLFDHRVDPMELHNVADDPRYAAVVAELDRRRLVLEGCAGAACSRQFGPLPPPG